MRTDTPSSVALPDTEPSAAAGDPLSYNDVPCWVYDALFELNVEVDFVPHDAINLAE
ncbi:hypothetical protein [Kineococcus rubinsiae]|uniref:hypothetical protein n=1 Tax=Kineococcus rubinsiae TaxID=2609562 RepID=UPI0014309DB8|nr:hypothetical protein [Kineococcus rubinsiae]